MSAYCTSRLRLTRVPLIAVAAITCSALLLPPHAAMAKNNAGTLGVLVSRNGPAGICFRRVYDSNHLKRHAGQTISRMTVLLKPEAGSDSTAQSFSLYAAIDLRNDPDRRYGMASCWWETGANLYGGRKRVLPFLASNDATRCMSGVNPNSAEEAGELVLGDQREGETLFVFNGFYQMRSGTPGARFMRDVAFGKEDQVLRLSKADMDACSGIEEALSEPVKAQNR